MPGGKNSGFAGVRAAPRSLGGENRTRWRPFRIPTSSKRTTSSASAQVIISNGVAHVIDCGDGVARQMAFAGVPMASLRHVFITHQHSDHTADWRKLVLSSGES